MVDEFYSLPLFATLFSIEYYAFFLLPFITNAPEEIITNAIANNTKEFSPPVIGNALALTITFIVNVVSLLSLSVTLYVTL